MGVWGQRGRRSRRSPARLLGNLLKARYGAAEGILGVVAMVLVVWLLWPEEQGPRLNDRVAWQETVDQAEKRRAALGGAQAARGSAEVPGADQETASAARPERGLERSLSDDGRRIARPSELADRVSSADQRRTFLPGAKRPSGSDDEAGEQKVVQPLATASDSDSVRAALSRMVDNLRAEAELPPDPADPADPVDPLGDLLLGDDAPSLDIAALSSEALDAEPLPEVDLSDLDTLIPFDDIEGEASDPASEAVSDTAPDAAIEPLALVPDAAAPTTDVRERPRDDAPSWLKNAVTTAVADERPMIAVVIDDLGLNRPKTAALNELPSPLTLAFLPYAGRIDAQTEAAQAAGHELMLHLPMEPVGSEWPGPNALTTRIDEEEFADRLEKNLGRFDGFVGINNHMGSKLTADRTRMDVVMRELRKRDVLFLDSKTSARSVAGDVAAQNGVPNTTRDVFLDHVIDIATIKRQLSRVESIARRTGSAVAIGHPHGATIEALSTWLPSLEARGFVLAPISAVVARRACSSGVLIADETCGRYLQARNPSSRAVVAKDG